VRAVAHCLIAAITICSWLAISNHCAIRALTTKAEKTQSACPFHSKPAKPKTSSTECCKILRATPNLPAKTLAPAIVDLAPANFFDLVVAAPRKISFATATLDTGPPGKTSFAELNRSMRAHAPPFVA
jgi:hypothetical protein